jgi:hypothetical protein
MANTNLQGFTAGTTGPSSGSLEGALLMRVRGEYREMPGLQLTIEQAMRLWALDRSTVTSLFEALVAGRFLEVDASGRYRMASGGY